MYVAVTTTYFGIAGLSFGLAGGGGFGRDGMFGRPGGTPERGRAGVGWLKVERIYVELLR